VVTGNLVLLATFFAQAHPSGGGGSSPAKIYGKDPRKGVASVGFGTKTADSGLFVDIRCMKSLRATGVACNKPFQTPGFHAINRGSNAGDHIAYNPASGAEFTGPLACRFRRPSAAR
jgi:hypothetical protein